MVSDDGEGTFVYQMHFSGLSAEEVELSLSELIQRDVDVHGDLRWTIDKSEAVGLTVPENKGVDLLRTQFNGSSVRTNFVRKHHDSWLAHGQDEPEVFQPAAGKMDGFEKMYFIDGGDITVGVMHKRFVELFLDGDHLQGRISISFVPVRNDRMWTLTFTDDETPTAGRTTMERKVSALQESAVDHKWLVWNDPRDDEPPKKVDVERFGADEVQTFRDKEELLNALWKRAEDKQ